MRRMAGIVVLLLAAGAAAVWAYRAYTPSEDTASYEFAPVERGEVRRVVEANGTLQPVKLVLVGTQVSGRVARIHVDFNDSVQAGQVLAELDPALLKADLATAQADLAKARTQAALTKAQADRAAQLVGEGLVSKEEVQQKQLTAESAQADVLSAQAKVQRTETNLSYTVIVSPVAGTIISRDVNVGQTVAASLSAPTLFQIAQDLSEMQINTNVAEADIGGIRAGLPVEFTVDAFRDRRFEGRVEEIRLNPTTVSNVVTYNVVVSVSNPDKQLLPGMTAFASFVLDHRDDVLTVPAAALRVNAGATGARAQQPNRGTEPGAQGAAPPADAGSGGPRRMRRTTDQRMLLVRRAGVVQPLPVRIGITDGQKVEIVEGLSEGDEVAVARRGASEGQQANQPPPQMRRLF